MPEMSEKIDLERIYVTFKDKIARYIRGKIANEQEAEDLTSEVFVKVFHRLSDFDESKSSLSTWIYTITRNTVTDYFRTAKRFCELSEEVCAEDNIEERLLNEEALELLAEALERLAKFERDIIILHYYSGKTLKSIAEVMNLSYSYVKLLHAGALKKLRGLIDERDMRTKEMKNSACFAPHTETCAKSNRGAE